MQLAASTPGEYAPRVNVTVLHFCPGVPLLGSILVKGTKVRVLNWAPIFPRVARFGRDVIPRKKKKSCASYILSTSNLS